MEDKLSDDKPSDWIKFLIWFVRYFVQFKFVVRNIRWNFVRELKNIKEDAAHSLHNFIPKHNLLPTQVSFYERSRNEH